MTEQAPDTDLERRDGLDQAVAFAVAADHIFAALAEGVRILNDFDRWARQARRTERFERQYARQRARKQRRVRQGR